MAEMILDPGYWKRRLKEATNRGEPHLAVFRCPIDRWRRIEDKHRDILATTIGDNDSILDVGCGWGRLLSLLPESWRGRYVGIDIAPVFIERAHLLYPVCDRSREFLLWTMREAHNLAGPRFDWAVLVSVRPMVVRNLGQEWWDAAEKSIRAKCERLLYLEYDENNDGGGVE